MIPAFPKFKKLEITDKNDVENITSQFQPSSDFNFLGLWSYNIADDIKTSLLYGNLVIKSRDYLTQAPFFSFLGANKFAETAIELIGYARRMGIDPRLRLIPQDNLKNISVESDAFVLEEDRDNHDYVYSTKELSDLVGSQYGKKRNLLNKFKRTYERVVSLTLDVTRKIDQKSLFDVFTMWGKNKKIPSTEAEHELIALQRLFSDAHHFNVFALVLKNEDMLIGFSVIELVKGAYAMCHFSKADTRFYGVYEALYHEIGKELDAKGYLYLNREQDLGISGLRMAKSDWNPVHFIKKYTIHPKL